MDRQIPRLLTREGMEAEEGQDVCGSWKPRDHEVSGERLVCRLTHGAVWELGRGFGHTAD